jgi:hypothetical protein
VAKNIFAETVSSNWWKYLLKNIKIKYQIYLLKQFNQIESYTLNYWTKCHPKPTHIKEPATWNPI